MESLLNTFFPIACLFCKTQAKDIICNKCLLSVSYLDHDYCIVCDKFSINGMTHTRCAGKDKPSQILSVFNYQGIVRQCIKVSKYKSKEFMALKSLTKHACDFISKYRLDLAGFIVMPIPVSVEKFRSRGFNQAELVSKIVAQVFNLLHESNGLKRGKHTLAQYEKSRKERFANVAGVFALNKNVEGHKVLLVDDICTTGATLLEASKTLYSGGAVDVRCFTLAKKVI